jgi:hypothetical protein
MEQKHLSYEEFPIKAIRPLRDRSRSRGFNSAFRKYFHDDPVAVMKNLESQGKIVFRPRNGGVMIYLQGDTPTIRDDHDEQALMDQLSKENISYATTYCI